MMDMGEGRGIGEVRAGGMEELGGVGKVAQWGERDGDEVGGEGEKEITRWDRGKAGEGREKERKTQRQIDTERLSILNKGSGSEFGLGENSQELKEGRGQRK